MIAAAAANLSWAYAALLWCGWGIALVVTAQVLPLIVFLFVPRKLGATDSSGSLPGGAAWPGVTVVVPARDEEAAIGRAMRSLLALDYPDLRIVAVDDRSSDATGPILDDLAAADARLEVVHVKELPAGWLGKNHANWIGASHTESSWILFTDGDIEFEPWSLRSAVRRVTGHGLDHLTALPGLIPGGIWEDLMVWTFSVFFFFRFQPWLVRTRLKRAYVGVGAFNLVSRAAYEAIGTHRRLAMEVADDVKLGKLVKSRGLRQDVVDGSDALRVRWQIGLGGVVRGLTKNAFAGMNYSLPLTVTALLAMVLLFVAPFPAALAVAGPARWGFLWTSGALLVPFAIILGKARRPLWITFLFPIGVAVFIFIVVRSTVITLRQGGVVWRETFYPLEELRKGVV